MSSSPPSSPPSPKRRRLQSSVSSSSSSSLLSLSDDVLLHIFSFVCNMSDLVSLVSTCPRLARVAKDPRLWTHVDSRQLRLPLALSEWKRLLNVMTARTRLVAIKGFLGAKTSLKESLNSNNITLKLFQSIGTRCPRLRELILDSCHVDATRIRIDEFFASLEVLRLVNTEFDHLPCDKSYFKDMHTVMPMLTVIDLSDSRWVNNHALMAISKNERLRELCLKGCFRIGECFAYTALATRPNGFASLEVLDLRDTRIGQIEVSCFAKLPSLNTLYLGRSKAASISSSSSSENEGLNDYEGEGDGVINDRGFLFLAHDANSCKLENLGLSYTQVSDKVFGYLCRLPRIKWMDLRGTRVSSQGIDEFLCKTSSCQVVWDE